MLHRMSMAFQGDNPPEEERLLALFAAGDAAAARLLAERFMPLAYRLALRLLSDRAEAEDVAQEAMLRLFRSAAGWRAGEARLSTWLYRVAANLCVDRLRRRPHLDLEKADAVEDGRATADEMVMAARRQEALSAALALLPERQRLAVVLRHIEGLQNPEIAVIMEVGVEAVESLVARGKRGLMSALAARRAELGYDDGT